MHHASTNNKGWGLFSSIFKNLIFKNDKMLHQLLMWQLATDPRGCGWIGERETERERDELYVCVDD